MNQNDKREVEPIKTPFTSKFDNNSLIFDWSELWGSGGTYKDGFGYTKSNYGHDIAIDSQDNIYFVGSACMGSSKSDFCVVKYDNEGSQLWNQTWGDSRYDYAMGVAIDSNDNVYVAGTYHKYYFDDPVGGDMAVIKYNSSGSKIWQQTYGGSNNDECYGIAIDSNDNIYLAGSRDYGAHEDFLVVKYSNSGSLQWGRTFGGSYPDICGDIAIDSNDNIFLIGRTNSYGTPGWFNFLLVKYNKAGTRLWYKTWGGQSDNFGYEITIDSSNNIYVVGFSDDNTNPREVTLVKFSNSGSFIWAQSWNGGNYAKSEYNDCGAITTGLDNNIYVTSLQKNLWVFNSSGDLQGKLDYYSSNMGTPSAMAFDSSGNLYIGGKKEVSHLYYQLSLVKYWSRTLEIDIISPNYNDLYGQTAPDFELSLKVPKLNETWYSLSAGLNITFYGSSGTINQSAWNSYGNGTVNIRFYVNNSLGDIAHEDVIIRKDIEPPSWDSLPEDRIVELGDNFSYKLNSTDSSGITNWWINDTINFSITNSGLITNTILLDVGSYHIEVKAYDPAGNYCNATFSVIVQDTLDPTWDEIPTDQIVEFTGDLSYDLNVIDLSGIDHWWINDTINFNITNTGLITDIVLLSVGEYHIEVKAYDPYGNYCNATFKIIVQNMAKPIWDDVPTDQIVEYGENLYYDLNASDLSGIDHWWINDTLSFSINDDGIISNIVSLSPGVYYLEVRAYDPLGNYCNATFRIVVLDTTIPAWDEVPIDQVIEFGEDLYYNLNASDLSGIDHWWINDTLSFSITDDGILTNIVPLSPGVHYLEVRAYDPYGNYCNATFRIVVLDTTLPAWDEIPIDQIVEFGENLYYNLNASDLSGIDHWWINATLSFSITVDGIISNIVPLSPGVHYLEVRAYDPYGNYCNATFRIVVLDTTIPAWDEVPIDQIVEFGEVLYYDLNASDLSGIEYWWINDTSYLGINDGGLITNIIDLPIGEYQIEVRAFDPFGNYCNATFKIIVQDAKEPAWDQVPIDQIVEFGENLFYDLNASDLSGIEYWWINDTSKFNITDDGILINIVPISPCVNYLEVRAYDPYGNYCNATLKITVQDTIIPNWDGVPTDQIVTYGENLYYDLNASDLSGIDHYWINDTSSFNIDDDGVLTNIVSLSPGAYYLEVRAYDPWGNFCLSNIKISVISETPTQQPPFVIGIIILISIIGGMGVIGIILYLLRKKRHTSL
ncbi:MAG: SBBP repeat-containing protein [Promethearchaeota archaeon]